MVSIKMYIFLSFLMIFIKFDYSYCTQKEKCYANIGEYFEKPLDRYTGSTILEEIFERISSKNFGNDDIRDYMKRIHKELQIDYLKIKVPTEFCQNNPVEHVSILTSYSTNFQIAFEDCVRKCYTNGFDHIDKQKIVKNAFYDIALVNITDLKDVTNYIRHLMKHITLRDGALKYSLNAYTFCEDRETCRDKIERDIPDIDNYRTTGALIRHIFLNIVVDKLSENLAKEYVQWLIAYKVLNTESSEIEKPKAFCKRIASNSENSSSFWKKKSTKNTEEVSACTNDVNQIFSDSVLDNIYKGFEELSLDTLQAYVYARQYMEYLAEFIEIEEKKLPCGWKHFAYCKKFKR